MGSPVALVAEPGPEVRRQLGEGEEVAWLPGDAGGVLYIPVEGRAELLAVGPLPAYPMPDPVPRLVLLLSVMGGRAVATGLLLRPLDRSQRSVAASAARLASGEMTARIDPADAEAGPGLDTAPTVRAVPRLLRRAIDNLVGNARRYARTTVRVDAALDADAVWIHIDDDGPGIPEADRPSALGAFATLDEKSGHGMGLAIMQRIVVAHGGEVRLATAPLGGLRVALRWPRS